MPPKSTKKKAKQAPPASSSSPAHHQQHQHQPPDWPPLKPRVPAADLTLTPILDDQIYIIRNLLPASLCRTLVAFLSSSVSLSTTPGHPRQGEAVRVNDRFQVDDPRFAGRLWNETGLGEVVAQGWLDGEGEGNGDGGEGAQDLWGGEVLGLNPNIRIYRYTPGQFFAQHYDDSVSLQYTTPAHSAHDAKPSSTTTTTAIPAKTTWTLLIYLTTCEGGETVFYPDDDSATKSKKSSAAAARGGGGGEPVEVGMEVGMGLLHRHGERCLLHEGREVKGGVKWVVRSDLVVRR